MNLFLIINRLWVLFAHMWFNFIAHLYSNNFLKLTLHCFCRWVLGLIIPGSRDCINPESRDWRLSGFRDPDILPYRNIGWKTSLIPCGNRQRNSHRLTEYLCAQNYFLCQLYFASLVSLVAGSIPVASQLFEAEASPTLTLKAHKDSVTAHI